MLLCTVECSLPEDKSSGVLRHLVRGMILTQRPGVLVGLAGHREMYKSCGERPARRLLRVRALSMLAPTWHARVMSTAFCVFSNPALLQHYRCLLVVLGVGNLLAARAAGVLQLLGLQGAQAAGVSTDDWPLKMEKMDE